MANEFIDTKTAAKLLDVTPSRIRQLILDKRLTAQKIGNSWMIVKDDLTHIEPRPLGRPPQKNG